MMMKIITSVFTFTLLLIFLSVSLSAQKNGDIRLSIDTSEINSNMLFFKVENGTDQIIVTGEFMDSKNNRLIVKDPQGLDVTYHFYRTNSSVRIPSKSSFQWEFDLNKFFYPDIVPNRWAANEGPYQIYWKFNGLISDVYTYNYSR